MQTCATPGGHFRGGFTLIEFILVMSLLAMVFALAAPSLSRFFRGRTLDSEARRFLALTRYGQSRAVSEGVPMVLWLDPNAGTYGLQQEQTFSVDDSKAVSFELARDLSFELDEGDSRSRSAGAGGAVLSAKNFGQLGPTRSDVPVIRFQPDGFIAENSPSSVWIREGEQDQDAVWISQSRNRLNYEIQTNIWQRAGR